MGLTKPAEATAEHYESTSKPIDQFSDENEVVANPDLEKRGEVVAHHGVNSDSDKVTLKTWAVVVVGGLCHGWCACR